MYNTYHTNKSKAVILTATYGLAMFRFVKKKSTKWNKCKNQNFNIVLDRNVCSNEEINLWNCINICTIVTSYFRLHHSMLFMFGLAARIWALMKIVIYGIV